MNIRLVPAVVFAALVVSACSNDSAFEGISEKSGRDARVVDAQASLDGRNYDAAIDDLELIYTTTALDAEVSRMLASAYMGRAGIDFTLLMKQLPAQSSDHPFDVMAEIISSPYETIDDGELYLLGNAVDGKTEKGEDTFEADLLEDLSTAKHILTVLDESGLATADDLVQLGFASAAHFILHIGNQTAIALNPTMRFGSPDTWQYGIVPVPINTKAYRYYKTSMTTDWKYNWAFVSPSHFKDDTAAGSRSSFQEDLENVRLAVRAVSQAYPGASDLRNTMEAFLRSALGVEPGEDITEDLILEYSSSGVYSFANRLGEGR
ncbi:MAG TPA: hypothetical protein PLT69_09090 [Deltaproteobacteria bacterium]|nr:hypothetical protein [Deltaproteobacteria bacterium]